VPSLKEYERKRRFATTPEPAARPRAVPQGGPRWFCVQQHRASRMHFDLRLEMGGVLKSWAVPKGPTLDPEVRRLAMETEDHPLDYLRFEGVIPEGNYGAGEVIVWDLGTYEIVGDEPPLKQYERGQIKFILRGKKLRGTFALARMHPREEEKGRPWLLIKKHDDAARFGDLATQHPGSVISGLRVESSAAPDPAAAGKARARGSARGKAASKAAPAPARPRAAPSPRQRPASDSAAALPGAARAPLPRSFHPMLATLSARPFRSPDWIFEVKWDGVRALAFRRDGKPRLVSRSGRDITRVYPELAVVRDALPASDGDFLLDGEIVALDAEGRSRFELLQRRMNLADTAAIARLRAEIPVAYYCFDVVHAGGASLLRTPLRERKAWLQRHLITSREIRYSDHIEEDGIGLFERARAKRLEGIVGKRLDSLYEQRRSSAWLKFKVQCRQEAVIVGYTDPQGSRDYFGALLLALWDPQKRRFYSVGRVGTGFDRDTRRMLLAKMRALSGPSAGLPPVAGGHAVPPALVAEVRFAEWTQDGKMRAPAFLGLREDKDPRECVREAPAAG